uniref:Uncharacterized protein n=1 Tax=Marinobacter nauticus TaxID=2743 RepID=A0A455WBN6_MARNT|nr:hypothetical protein YBY_07060 [Marinobacter nauticus]
MGCGAALWCNHVEPDTRCNAFQAAETALTQSMKLLETWGREQLFLSPTGPMNPGLKKRKNFFTG